MKVRKKVSTFESELAFEPDAESVDPKLGEVARKRYAEARKGVLLTKQKTSLERRLKRREARMMLSLRQQKAKDKGFTEKVIAATIMLDPLMIKLQQQIDELTVLESLQKERVSSLTMSYGSLKAVKEGLNVERMS